MRAATKFVCTFSVNGGPQEVMEGPNKAKLVDQIRRTIRERAGEFGNAQFEIRKVYTDQEREKLNIPANIHGLVDQRTQMINGKWKMETPFKEYF